jgi:class 3 adenylate cyclase
MLVAEQPDIAVAVHSGECELRSREARGIAVDLAVQLAASTPPGQVLVTQTILDLIVGSPIRLQPAGCRAFPDISDIPDTPGTWDVFTVLAAQS